MEDRLSTSDDSMANQQLCEQIEAAFVIEKKAVEGMNLTLKWGPAQSQYAYEFLLMALLPGGNYAYHKGLIPMTAFYDKMLTPLGAVDMYVTKAVQEFKKAFPQLDANGPQPPQKAKAKKGKKSPLAGFASEVASNPTWSALAELGKKAEEWDKKGHPLFNPKPTAPIKLPTAADLYGDSQPYVPGDPIPDGRPAVFKEPKDFEALMDEVDKTYEVIMKGKK